MKKVPISDSGVMGAQVSHSVDVVSNHNVRFTSLKGSEIQSKDPHVISVQYPEENKSA